jgi:hypothetical protein
MEPADIALVRSRVQNSFQKIDLGVKLLEEQSRKSNKILELQLARKNLMTYWDGCLPNLAKLDFERTLDSVNKFCNKVDDFTDQVLKQP